MAEKDWKDLARREKDQRRVDAFKAGVADLVAAGKTEREAKREQEPISNKSWAEYRRDDGHK